MYTEKEREIQRRMIQNKMQRISAEIERARGAAVMGRVADVERIVRSIREQTYDKGFPREFSAKTASTLKALELDANVKLVDLSLERAREFALQRLEGKKSEAIKLAREHLGKAMMLGAHQIFKTLALRKIELIAYTGSLHPEGPTKAKPLDALSKPANIAKDDKRQHIRFSNPKLQILLDNQVLTSIDWSLGGMLISNYNGVMDRGEEIKVRFGLIGSDSPYSATVCVMRRDPKRKALAVRFIRSTMEALEFFHRLLKQQGQRAL